MSRELLASKVVVFEEQPKVRGIPTAGSAVAGAVGTAERGPTHKAVLCTSFDEYQATFGGFGSDANLALAAMGFFENGGGQLWVSRVASATATTAAANFVRTEGGGGTPAILTAFVPPTWSIGTSSSLDLGLIVDGDYTLISLSFSAGPGIVSGGANAVLPPYALTDGDTLLVSVNGGATQTVTFGAGAFTNIGAASISEVAAVINAQLVGATAGPDISGGTYIQSLRNGSSSSIAILGGAASFALGLSGALGNGFGLLPNNDLVHIYDIAAAAATYDPPIPLDFVDGGGVLKIATHALGSNVTLRIEGSGDAYVALGIPPTPSHGTGGQTILPVLHVEAMGPGTGANNLSVAWTAASGGDTTKFDLVVYDDGVQAERHKDLSRDPTALRFVESVVNDVSKGSTLVRVTNTTNFPTLPADPNQVLPLADGTDGEPLTDADFIGLESDKTGFHAFDRVPDVSILLAPGRATPEVHLAMLQYCEVERDGMTFAVLDPPAATSAVDMVTYVTTTAALENVSEFGAIYWPRVKVLNPDKNVFGTVPQIVVPPSGIIAGVYARTDSARPGGVYDPPAGTERGRTFGVLGYDHTDTLEERKRDLVYPHRINPLTSEPGLPWYIDGSRTLDTSGRFPFVAERRGVQFIERSLKKGLAFARHQPNTPELRAQVRRTITAFLITQMNNGAFRSDDPSKAFFVDVSDALNTPLVVASGKVIARIGLATNKPAEYVLLHVSQDTRALDAELAV